MRVLLLSLCLVTTQIVLAAREPRPSDRRVENEIGTLVLFAESYPDEILQKKVAGMKAFNVVMVLTRVVFECLRGPNRATPDMQRKIKKFEARGIRLGATLRPSIGEFRTFGCKSMQSEANKNLKALYVGQEF